MGATRFGHALRAIVSTIVALAAWLVLATPAFAGEDRDSGGRSAAPQCDTRGATTFAPAPNLDPPQASIDVGDDDGACLSLTTIESFRTGTPSDEAPPPRAEAIVPRAHRVPAAGSYALPLTHSHADGARSGIRVALERPPR
jgi:hypothetical protein